MKKLMSLLVLSISLVSCIGINAAEKEVAKTKYEIALQKLEEIKLKKEEVARAKHLLSLDKDLVTKFKPLTLEQKTNFYLFVSKVSDYIKTSEDFFLYGACGIIDLGIEVQDSILEAYRKILITHINHTQFLEYNAKVVKAVEKDVLAGIKSKL